MLAYSHWDSLAEKLWPVMVVGLIKPCDLRNLRIEIDIQKLIVQVKSMQQNHNRAVTNKFSMARCARNI